MAIEVTVIDGWKNETKVFTSDAKALKYIKDAKASYMKTHDIVNSTRRIVERDLHLRVSISQV